MKRSKRPSFSRASTHGTLPLRSAEAKGVAPSGAAIRTEFKLNLWGKRRNKLRGKARASRCTGAFQQPPVVQWIGNPTDPLAVPLGMGGAAEAKAPRGGLSWPSLRCALP